ncbi:MAG: hypothetical protein IJF92_03765 [Bacilli bacterium]|nr:hypothetical protein [Bacilli bacterium]
MDTKNVKLRMKNIKNSLGAVSLSIVLGTMSLGGLTGCSKDGKFKSDYSSTVYSVDKSDDQKAFENIRFINSDYDSNENKIDDKYANYDRYIDFNKIKKFVDFGYDYTNKNLDYVYPYKTCNYQSHNFEKDKIKTFKNGNRKYSTMSTAMFIGNGVMYLPRSLKWAEDKFGPVLHDHNVDQLVEMEYLAGANGNLYMHYEYTVAARKRMNAPGNVDGSYIKKYGLPKDIKKGDYIHYEALYLYNPEKSKFITICDKQTGIGSKEINVTEKVFNNYDDVIKPITNKKEKSESESFDSNTEFKEFIYDKGQVKQKVKVK